MTGEKVNFIKKAPKDIRLIWSIPGGDLYNRYLRYFGYPIVYRENRNIKYFIGKKIRWLSRRLEYDYLIKRCTAVVCANCDFLLIKKYANKTEKLPTHIYSIAYPMERMLGELYGKPFIENKKKKIVIGNSASRTNNHLYVLQYLKSLNAREEVDISLLMSYGHSDEKYKNKVKTAYRTTFGESVSFVIDYVPLDEFNRRLLTVTHFVYGNWRQEAVGNILTAFYLGAKVYLSKRNPLLEDFRSKGFIVFCLEEMDTSFDEPLSLNEKTHNRLLIDKLYNLKRAANMFVDGLLPILNGKSSN